MRQQLFCRWYPSPEFHLSRPQLVAALLPVETYRKSMRLIPQTPQ